MIELLNPDAYRPGSDRQTAEKINELIEYANAIERMKENVNKINGIVNDKPQ